MIEQPSCNDIKGLSRGIYFSHIPLFRNLLYFMSLYLPVRCTCRLPLKGQIRAAQCAIARSVFFFLLFFFCFCYHLHLIERLTVIVCSSHLQGAILTTMLATRNFSSKYDAQGKYLRPSSALYTDHDRQYFYISRLNFTLSCLCL